MTFPESLYVGSIHRILPNVITKFLYIIPASFSPQLPQPKISPGFHDSGLPLLVSQPVLAKPKCQPAVSTQQKYVGEVQISVTFSLPWQPSQNPIKNCKNPSNKNTTYLYIVNFSSTQFCQKNLKTSTGTLLIPTVFVRLLAKRKKKKSDDLGNKKL